MKLSVPTAVRAVAERASKQESLKGRVVGWSVAEELMSGEVRQATVVRMHRFFEYRDGELERAYRGLPVENAESLLLSASLMGGEAGRRWAASVYEKAVSNEEIDPDPIFDLMRYEPEEVYGVFQAGAWRDVYGLDVPKAAKFVEHYTRNTQRTLDLDRAFGESAQSVGKALYRRYHVPDPFEQAAKLIGLPHYAEAVREDLEFIGDNRALVQLHEGFKRNVLHTMPAITAGKQLWPAFIAYFVLAVEARPLVKELNRETLRPPKPTQKPRPFTAYNDPINTYVAYFHPDGVRVPKDDVDLEMFNEFSSEIYGLLLRAWHGRIIRRPLVWRLFRDLWNKYVRPHKLGTHLYRTMLAAWRARDYQKIADNIPPDADVYGPFQTFVAEQEAEGRKSKQKPVKDETPIAQRAALDKEIKSKVGSTATPVVPATTPLAKHLKQQTGKDLKTGDVIQLGKDTPKSYKVTGAYQSKDGRKSVITAKADDDSAPVTLMATGVGLTLYKNAKHIPEPEEPHVELPEPDDPLGDGLLDPATLSDLKEYLQDEYGEGADMLKPFPASKTLTYKSLLAKYANAENPEFGHGSLFRDEEGDLWVWVATLKPAEPFEYELEDGTDKLVDQPELVFKDADGNFTSGSDKGFRHIVKHDRFIPVLAEQEDVEVEPEFVESSLVFEGKDYTDDVQEVLDNTLEGDPPFDWTTVVWEETAFWKAAVNRGWDASIGSEWRDVTVSVIGRMIAAVRVQQTGEVYLVKVSGGDVYVLADKVAGTLVGHSELVPLSHIDASAEEPKPTPEAGDPKVMNVKVGDVVVGSFESIADATKMATKVFEGAALVSSVDDDQGTCGLTPMHIAPTATGSQLLMVEPGVGGLPKGTTKHIAGPIPLVGLKDWISVDQGYSKSLPDWVVTLAESTPKLSSDFVFVHAGVERMVVALEEQTNQVAICWLQEYPTAVAFNFMVWGLETVSALLGVPKQAFDAALKLKKPSDGIVLPGIGTAFETPEQAGIEEWKGSPYNLYVVTDTVQAGDRLPKLGSTVWGEAGLKGELVGFVIGANESAIIKTKHAEGKAPELGLVAVYGLARKAADVWYATITYFAWDETADSYVVSSKSWRSLHPPAPDPESAPDTENNVKPLTPVSAWWLKTLRTGGIPGDMSDAMKLKARAEEQLAAGAKDDLDVNGVPSNFEWVVRKEYADKYADVVVEDTDGSFKALYDALYLATITIFPHFEPPVGPNDTNAHRTHVFASSNPAGFWFVNLSWNQMAALDWTNSPPEIDAEPFWHDGLPVEAEYRDLVDAVRSSSGAINVVAGKSLLRAVKLLGPDEDIELESSDVSDWGVASMFRPGMAAVGRMYYERFKLIKEASKAFEVYSSVAVEAAVEPDTIPKPSFDPFSGDVESFARNPDVSKLKELGESVEGGSNPNYVLADDQGRRWLFKVHKSGNDTPSKAEALASEIAAEVSPEVIPVGFVMIKGKRGTLQPLLDDATTPDEQPNKLNDENKVRLLRQHAIDMLLGDHDGHAGNWLMYGGSLVPVDRGQSFKFLLDFTPDSLRPDWSPSGNFGQHYAKRLLLEWAAGDATIPSRAFGAMRGVIEALQKMSTKAWNARLDGLFEVAGLEAPVRTKLKRTFTARRKRYFKDWTKVLRGLRKDFEWPSVEGVPTTGLFKSTPVDVGFTHEEERHVADAARSPKLGKSLSIDRHYIEQQQVLVRPVRTEDKHGGYVDATLVYFRLTPDAGTAVLRLMKYAGIKDIAATGQQTHRLGVDVSGQLYEKLLACVKTIHYHLYVKGDKAFNQTTLNHTKAVQGTLTGMYNAASKDPKGTHGQTGDSNKHILQMVDQYRNYLRYINHAVEHTEPQAGGSIPKAIEPFIPPEEEEVQEAEHKTVPGLKVDFVGSGIQIPVGTPSGHDKAATLKALSVTLPQGHGYKQFRVRDEAAGAKLYVVPPRSTVAGDVVAGYAGVVWGLIQHKTDTAAVAHLLRMFEAATGIEMKPSAKADREYLYWINQAIVLQGTYEGMQGRRVVDAELQDATKLYAAGDTDKALASVRQYAASKLGAAKVAKMTPKLHYDPNGGFGRVLRADVDESDLVKELGPDAYPAHRLLRYSADTLKGFKRLEATRMLLANNLRPFSGVGFGVDGASPGSDLQAGGSGFIFGGLRRKGDGGPSTLYFDRSLLLRTDVALLGTGKAFGDAYGNPDRHWSHELTHYAAGVVKGEWLGAGGSHQLVIRHDVDLSQYLVAVECVKGAAAALIDWCYTVGWTQFAGGRKPEDVFFDSKYS